MRLFLGHDTRSLSPLEAALFARFGTTNLNAIDCEVPVCDSDGDGMSDLDEIRAEFDPGAYEQEFFLAEIVSIDSNGVTIEFACVIGESYTILRTGNPGVNVEAIGTVPSVSETGYTTFVDANAGDDCFYWIQQD